ncbi:MAG: MTH865 family protein [Methanocella sp.]
MTIDKPKYTEHAQAPGARGIKELDMLKVKVVEMAEGAAVKFPINNKSELLKVFPKSTPMGCSYKGETMTMYQLIQHLDDSDFPIKNAGDLATILTTRCYL